MQDSISANMCADTMSWAGINDVQLSFLITSKSYEKHFVHDYAHTCVQDLDLITLNLMGPANASCNFSDY